MPKPKRSSSFYVPSEDGGGSLSSAISSSIQNDQTIISSEHNNGGGTHQKTEMAGWLQKWTNYMKGYRQRWFVLDRVGNLRYYRGPTHASGPARGQINMAEAKIHSGQQEGSNNLVISAGQTFHLKAANEADRSKWLKALGYAKHRAIQQAAKLEDDEDESQLLFDQTMDLLKELPPLRDRMSEMANSLQAATRKFINELDKFAQYAPGKMATSEAKNCAERLKHLKEQAEKLAQTTNEVLAKYKKEYEVLSRLATSQNEKYQEIQGQYEILARQHSYLEREAFNTLKRVSAAETPSASMEESSSMNQQQKEQSKQMIQQPPFVAEDSDQETENSSTQQRQIEREDQEEEEAAEEEEDADEAEDQFHDASDNLAESKPQPAPPLKMGLLGGDSDSIGVQTKTANGATPLPANFVGGIGGAGRRDSNAPMIGSCKLELSKCVIHMPHHSGHNIDEQENTQPVTVPGAQPTKQRRDRIPPKPESHGLNLWSIMKNCIGKELTRIPIPVNFNEPLSMLQRITEDLEYAYLLDRAAEKEDICERLAYVGAYAISSYSGTARRTTKPFNPLLGETFELDRRDDLGWRSLVEQVSHHPPAAAHHAEGVNWTMHQEFMVSSRFRGKYLSVIPTGYTHVDFNDGKAMCTFQKITTTVQNIIVGKLWIDNHGDMQIVNHVGGERAIIKFHAYSYFSSAKPRKVEGLVLNREGETRFALEGYWDQYIDIAPVTAQHREGKNKLIVQTGQPRRIWRANQSHAGPSMYNFSKLAIEMNEPDERVAPTDSRRRPDQRLMEDGRWDEANKRKLELEEKQRKKRRQAEAEADWAMNNNQQTEEYSARWFQKVHDAPTGSVIHLIRDNEYWECKERQDWSRCPEIFE